MSVETGDRPTCTLRAMKTGFSGTTTDCGSVQAETTPIYLLAETAGRDGGTPCVKCAMEKNRLPPRYWPR